MFGAGRSVLSRTGRRYCRAVVASLEIVGGELPIRLLRRSRSVLNLDQIGQYDFST